MIKQNLETALRDAMREKDDVRKRTIRLALSSIKNIEIDKGLVLDDPAVISIIQKEIKNRKETIQDAQKGGRQDLIDEAQAEIAVLQTFLPVGLSESELILLAKDAINEAGATGISDMGKVMKILVTRAQGRASGSEISAVVSKLLSP